MIVEIVKRKISLSITLLYAMKIMDEERVKTLFVFDGEHFEGLLTLGDIQRAIIKNISLTAPVSSILNKNKIYGYASEGEDAIKAKIRRMRAEVMPILDETEGIKNFVVIEGFSMTSGMGENIAMGQTSATKVMTDWMNSSGHRANILNSKYKKIGGR